MMYTDTKHNNFHLIKDHHNYFLKNDALNPLTFDLTFSLTKRYTCHAGCKVCYIGQKLKDGFNKFSNEVPKTITDQDEQFWFDVFDYFLDHRTNDDLTYFRLNYPHLFNWYKKYEHIFEFGMTDNGFITQYNTLMKYINLRGLSDISLSETFLLKANKDGKILKILKELLAKYTIKKFKILATEKFANYPEVTSIINYLNEKGLENMLQHDFRYKENPRYELNEILKYQNSNVLSYNDRTYQIYKSCVHLYYDRFFYSVDDASDYDWPSFHIVHDKHFVPENLIVSMLKNKIFLYEKFHKEIYHIEDSVVQKFSDYFLKTQDFIINENFNFIPSFMLEKNTKFYFQLVKKRGFVPTEFGLVKPDSNLIPLVNFK